MALSRTRIADVVQVQSTETDLVTAASGLTTYVSGYEAVNITSSTLEIKFKLLPNAAISGDEHIFHQVTLAPGEAVSNGFSYVIPLDTDGDKIAAIHDGSGSDDINVLVLGDKDA